MLADDRKVEVDGLDGVLLYQDAAVPDRFYYSATRPGIARTGDDYQLTLVRYDCPRGGTAGMLSFVVDLRPPPAVLDRAMAGVRAIAPAAQLAPMPWTTGTVSAAVIGGAPIVTRPSLLGDNEAVVSLALTTEQYLLLDSARGDPALLPISVVYGLHYEALRPAYAFSVEVHADRLRDWLQKRVKVDLLFVSIEKIETFEDLRANGVITITSTNQTGEAPPDGFRRAFLQSLAGVLTPMPCFAPPPDGSGDAGWQLGFSAETIHDIQTITRRLDCAMQVSAAVTRTAVIQGVLTDLGTALRASPVIELPTHGSFQQAVTLRCQAAFDGNPLQSVVATIAPPTLSPATRVFDAAQPAEWQADLTYDPRVPADYRCSCELRFTNGRPRVIGNVGIAHDQAYVDLLPSVFYSFRSYTVRVSDDFPWALVRKVTVRLLHPGALAFDPAELVLREGTPSGVIQAFAPVPLDLDQVGFIADYVATADETTLHEEGLPSGATIFLNPLRRRQVAFAADPAADWTRWSAIAVTPVKGPGFQLWQPSRVLLTADRPRAPFAYWYGDGATLRCRTQGVRAGKATPGPDILSDATLIPVATPTTDPKQEGSMR